MTRKIFFFFVIAITLSFGFMHLLASIDPARETVGGATFSKSFVSVSFSLFLMAYLSVKTEREQLSQMRADGLSEDKIRRIVGEQQYRQMLKANKGFISAVFRD